MTLFVRRTLVFAVAVGSAACTDKPTEPGSKEPDVIVATDGSQFLPTYVTIPVGGTVRFDIIPAPNGEGHDVTFRPGQSGAPANVPVTLTGKVDRTFLSAGTFVYDCKVHPGMFGEIKVE
jgi:plastocyanin